MLHRLVLSSALGAVLLVPAVAHTQDRDGRGVVVDGERQTRRFKVGEAGSLRLANLAGDIVVTGGASGGEIVVDAVRRARGRGEAEARQMLELVQVTMNQMGARVEVETQHRRGGRAWVDYTVSVPTGTTLELRSVSGDMQIRSVSGEIRAETVSGDVAASALPRISALKSVSGDVEIVGGGSDGDLTLSSVSGDVVARQVKARALSIESVSGDVEVAGCTCAQTQAQSVSGNVTFGGRLDKQGRYAFKSHSGDVTLSSADGFDLDAATFSGSIKAQVPLAMRGGVGVGVGEDRGPGRTMKGTVAGGGAYVEVRTFSGSILVTK